MRRRPNSSNSPPRVVVLGDSVLDVWLSGTCRRLSREGPAAVVDIEQSSVRPGAAANTAANVAALGAQTEIVTLIGDDDVGGSLRRELLRHRVGTEHTVVAAARTTPSKSRVVASNRVLLRFDQGDPCLAAAAEARQLADGLTAALDAADALVICDYRGDVAHSDVFAALEAVRHRLPLLVVDGHRLDAWRSVRPDVATPSAAESMALLPTANPDGQARADFFAAHRRQLADATGAGTVVVTLDSEGVLLLDGNRPPYRISAQRAPEENCAGAGDTFAAAMTVGLLQGMSAQEATDYGQRAADVVTGQPGTSVCTKAELDERMVGGAPMSSDELARRVSRHRSAGHRIVFTNGCFDVLHRGHVAYLKQARQAGDVLIVAINSDESVRRLKGWTRPINNETDRAAVLGELGCVDYVTVFDDDTPASLIQRLRPDIYVKGGDYTADMLPETPVVRSYGGEVRTLGYVANHSTTETIARIRASADC